VSSKRAFAGSRMRASRRWQCASCHPVLLTAGLDSSQYDDAVDRAALARLSGGQYKGTIVPLANPIIGDLQRWLVGTSLAALSFRPAWTKFASGHNRRQQPMAALQAFLGLFSWRNPDALSSRPGRTRYVYID
jgi:hypothetical protein